MVERESTSSEVRTGLAITGPSPFSYFSFSPIGSTGSSRSAKMMAASTSSISMGCRVTVAARSGRLQISRMPCFSRIWRYCFRYRPACRMNHTGLTSVGLRRQASGNGLSLEPRAWLFHPVFAKEHLKVPWPMLHRPLTAIDKIRFRPHLAIDRARRHYRNRNTALRRISSPRVHEVGVNLAFRPEKLLVAARGRHRRVFQPNLRQRIAVVPRVLDLHRPAPWLVRRRAHAVDAARRTRYQGHAEPVLSQNLHHAVDGVTFAHPAPG